MKKEIKIPPMGESISEATIATVLKPTGSVVKADEEVVEIETDKVNQVLFAPGAGVITLTVNAGDTVKIGQVIGFVDGEQTAKVEEKKIEEKKVEEIKPAPVPSKEAQPARISKNEELKDLLQADKPKEMPKVLSKTADTAPTKEKRTTTRKKLSRIREVIAKRLVQAKQETAMLTTFNEVDMTEIMKLREHYKEIFMKEHGVKLGFMSFFVKAAVAALQAFPEVNSHIEEGEVIHPEYYDIGIAVGTDRGLMVPVIRDCDVLTFAGIESKLEDYAKKARSGGLSVDDLTGGSFTITNGGTYGSLLSTPILNMPQSAILGMHKIEKRPVVVDDEIVIRPMMYLALSYDHRLIDGKEAVLFLVMIKNMLEDPARLLLEV